LPDDEAVLDMVGDPDERRTDVVLARDGQSRTDDERRVVRVEIHQRVEIFRRDGGVRGADESFEGMRCHEVSERLGRGDWHAAYPPPGAPAQRFIARSATGPVTNGPAYPSNE
jgi:hypothetical protein